MLRIFSFKGRAVRFIALTAMFAVFSITLAAPVSATVAAIGTMGVSATADVYGSMLLSGHAVNSLMDSALQGFSVYDRADSTESWSGGHEDPGPLLRLQAWAQPFAWFGRQETAGNGNMDQDFQGLAAGIALGTEVMNLGLAFHYARGELDASGYRADADIYGFTTGAGSHILIRERFYSWLALHAGYSRYKLDQERRNGFGGKAESRAAADLFSGGFALDNIFQITDEFAFGPRLGLDYSSIFMDGYTERNLADNLTVSPENHESLRGQLGLIANWQPWPELDIRGRAVWYWEMMDKRAELRVHDTGSPGTELTARGQKRGSSSLGLGLGLNWQPAGNFGLGLDYGLPVGGKISRPSGRPGFQAWFLTLECERGWVTENPRTVIQWHHITESRRRCETLPY